MLYARGIVSVVLLYLVAGTVWAADESAGADPANVDAAFVVQGEYVGMVRTAEGEMRVGVQVIALGGGKFQAVAYEGGLPGDGYQGGKVTRADGELRGSTAVFAAEGATASIGNGALTARDSQGREIGTLRKVARKSPTLGQKPPAGAVVLFDGSSADAFENGRLSDGMLMEGATSKQKFGDHTLHIEFRLPYLPEARGQGRGNSGVYLQGRYEVQVLDSFGLEGLDNECGGIYERRKPDVNMCFPPLAWQTYDIDFTAARYGEGGQLTSPPRLTVRHNGRVIHDDFALPSDEPTRAAPVPAGAEPGPLFLQDHGCPVRYRNIWVVEK